MRVARDLRNELQHNGRQLKHRPQMPQNLWWGAQQRTLRGCGNVTSREDELPAGDGATTQEPPVQQKAQADGKPGNREQGGKRHDVSVQHSPR